MHAVLSCRGLVVAAACIAISSSASASMILQLNDPALLGTEVVIIDGQPAGSVSDNGLISNVDDPDGLVNGFITYSGPAGPNFTSNVTTAISKPSIGPARIDLSDITLTSSLSGTLELFVTDTDFLFGGNGDVQLLVNEFGGVTDGAVTGIGAYDANNFEFGSSGPFVLQGPFGPGSFSDTSTSAPFVSTGAPFSLTERVEVVHDVGDEVTSFNKVLSVVPEPGTALLLGGGLLGLAAFGRRKPRR